MKSDASASSQSWTKQASPPLYKLIDTNTCKKLTSNPYSQSFPLNQHQFEARHPCNGVNSRSLALQSVLSIIRTQACLHLLTLVWVITWVATVPLFHTHLPDVNDGRASHHGLAHTVFSPDLPGEFSRPHS